MEETVLLIFTIFVQQSWKCLYQNTYALLLLDVKAHSLLYKYRMHVVVKNTLRVRVQDGWTGSSCSFPLTYLIKTGKSVT